MGREGRRRRRDTKRCGCLFSCQFLLETFPVRRKLEEEVKEHTRVEIWSSSLTLIWTPGAPGQVYNLPGATVMMVPPPLLRAVRSLSEVSVLYHPSAAACSSAGPRQDSPGLQTSTTTSKTASEQKRWIRKASQLLGDAVELTPTLPVRLVPAAETAAALPIWLWHFIDHMYASGYVLVKPGKHCKHDIG